jgi:hypothetical protein
VSGQTDAIAFETVVVRTAPDLVFVGPRFLRAYRWEMNEQYKWEGRDWRRIKRERNRFIRLTAPR